jgi:uncharacterized protein (TIGR04255 family)
MAEASEVARTKAVITRPCGLGIGGLRSPAVRFPDSERVIYEANPLAEVICQVRFPRILKIETELPAAFQEQVRAAYPNLKELHTTRIPPEVAHALHLESSGASLTYEFGDGSEPTWKVALTSNFVALTTVRYTRWEDFRSRLRFVLDALEQTYAVSTFTRVGLRYRDLISRSQLGMDEADWGQCLRPEILGELALPDFVGAARHASRQLVLSLDYSAALVRFSHGIVEAEDDQGAVERCYLIDADFYTEVETERKDAEGLLDQFNKESGRLFRWCITETLHKALRPTKPMGESGFNPG